MPRVTEKDLRAGKFRCFIYGGTGVGKTCLAGSALEIEDMCPIFYADFEDGIGSISGSLEKYWDRVHLWTMQSLEDMRKMSSVLRDPDTEYKTVIIDSASAWWSLLMKEHLAAQGRESGMPQIQDYGVVSDAILQLLRVAINRKTTNIIITCGESAQKDEISGGLYREPAMVGQLVQKMPPLFDLVGYLDADIKGSKNGEISEARRTLQVQPFSRVRAKSRLPRSFPSVLSEPSMAKIWEAWSHRFDTSNTTMEKGNL